MRWGISWTVREEGPASLGPALACSVNSKGGRWTWPLYCVLYRVLHLFRCLSPIVLGCRAWICRQSDGPLHGLHQPKHQVPMWQQYVARQHINLSCEGDVATTVTNSSAEMRPYYGKPLRPTEADLPGSKRASAVRWHRWEVLVFPVWRQGPRAPPVLPSVRLAHAAQDAEANICHAKFSGPGHRQI